MRWGWRWTAFIEVVSACPFAEQRVSGQSSHLGCGWNGRSEVFPLVFVEWFRQEGALDEKDLVEPLTTLPNLLLCASPATERHKITVGYC